MDVFFKGSRLIEFGLIMALLKYGQETTLYRTNLHLHLSVLLVSIFDPV